MPPVKKKPGRPKGSKNKDALVYSAQLQMAMDGFVAAAACMTDELKRGFSMIRRALEMNGYQVPPEGQGPLE